MALVEHSLALVTKLGARLMLQVALEEEVLAFLERDWYERRSINGAPGWRNGAKPRTVKVAGGDLTIPMPQVRGPEGPFPPGCCRLTPRGSRSWRRRSRSSLGMGSRRGAFRKPWAR
jgi:hypothetical protein